MEYNKNQFQKSNEKKVLHKIKKHWVVVSMSLLMALGGEAAATRVTHADTNTTASNGHVDNLNSVKERLNNNLVQQRQTSAAQTNNAPSKSTVQSSGSKASSTTNQQISSQASRLHQSILLNADQNHDRSTSSMESSSVASATSTKADSGFSTPLASSSLGASASNNAKTMEIGGIITGTSKNKYSIRIQYIDESNGRVLEPFKPLKFMPGTPFATATGPFALKKYTSNEIPHGYKFDPKGGPNHNGLADVPKEFALDEQIMKVYVQPKNTAPKINGRIVFHYIDHRNKMQVMKSGQQESDKPAGSPFTTLNEHLTNVPNGYHLWNTQDPSKNLSATFYQDLQGNTPNTPLSSIPTTFPKGTDNIFVQVTKNGESDMPAPNSDVKPAMIYAHYINQIGSDVTPAQFKASGQPIFDMNKIPAINTPVNIESDNPNPNYHLDIPQGYTPVKGQQHNMIVGNQPQQVIIHLQGDPYQGNFVIHRYERISGKPDTQLSDKDAPISSEVGSKLSFMPGDFTPNGMSVDQSDTKDNHKVTTTIEPNEKLVPDSATFVYTKIPEGTINVSYVDQNKKPLPKDTSYNMTQDVGTKFTITNYMYDKLPVGTTFESVLEGNNVNAFQKGVQNVVIQVHESPHVTQMNIYYKDISDAHAYRQFLGTLPGNVGQTVSDGAIGSYTSQIPQMYQFIKIDPSSSKTFQNGSSAILDVKRRIGKIIVHYVDTSNHPLTQDKVLSDKAGTSFNVSDYKNPNIKGYTFYQISQGDNITTFEPGNQDVTIMMQPVKTPSDHPNQNIKTSIDIHYMYDGKQLASDKATGKPNDPFVLKDHETHIPDPKKYQVESTYGNVNTFPKSDHDIFVNLKSAQPSSDQTKAVINIKYVNVDNNQQLGHYSVNGKVGAPFNLSSYENTQDGMPDPSKYTIVSTGGYTSNFMKGTWPITVYMKPVQPKPNPKPNPNQPSKKTQGTVDLHYMHNGTEIGHYNATGNSSDAFILKKYVDFPKFADGLNDPSQYQVDSISNTNIKDFGTGIHDIYINLRKANNTPQTVHGEIVFKDVSDNNAIVQPTIPLSGTPGTNISNQYMNANHDIPAGYSYDGMGPHGNLELTDNAQYVINVKRDSYHVNVQYVDPNGKHIGTPIVVPGKYNTPFNIKPYENNDIPPHMKFDNVLSGGNIHNFTPATNNGNVIIQVSPNNPNNPNNPNHNNSDAQGTIQVSYVDDNGHQIGTVSDVTEKVGDPFNISKYTNSVPNGYHYESIEQGSNIKAVTNQLQKLVIKVAKNAPNKGVINIHYMNSDDAQIGLHSTISNVNDPFHLIDYENPADGMPSDYHILNVKNNVMTFEPGIQDVYVYLAKNAPVKTQGIVNIHYINNGIEIGHYTVHGPSSDHFNLSDYENSADGMPSLQTYQISKVENDVKVFGKGIHDVYVDMIKRTPNKPSDNKPSGNQTQGTVNIHYMYDGQQVGFYPVTGKSSDVFQLAYYENMNDHMPDPSEYKIVDVDGNVDRFGTGTHDIYVILNRRHVTTEGTINVKYVNSNGIKIDSDSLTEDTGRPFDMSFYKDNIPSGYQFESVIEGNNVNKFNAGTQDVVIEIKKLSLTNEGIITVQYMDPNNHPVSKLHTIIENTGNHFDLPYYEENVPANYHFIKVLNGGQVNTFNKGTQNVQIEVAPDSYVNPSDSDATMDVVYKDINNSDVISNHLVAGANGTVINRDRYKDYIPNGYHFVKYGDFDNILKNGDHNVIYIQSNQSDQHPTNNQVTINIIYKTLDGEFLSGHPVKGTNGQLINYSFYESHGLPVGYVFAGKIDGFSTFRQGDDDVIYVKKSSNNTNNNGNNNNNNGNNNGNVTPNNNGGNDNNGNNNRSDVTPHNNGNNGNNNNRSDVTPHNNGGNSDGNGNTPNSDSDVPSDNSGNNGNNGSGNSLNQDLNNNASNTHASRLNNSINNNNEIPQTGESATGQKSKDVGKILMTLASALGALGVVMDRRRRKD